MEAMDDLFCASDVQDRTDPGVSGDSSMSQQWKPVAENKPHVPFQEGRLIDPITAGLSAMKLIKDR